MSSTAAPFGLRQVYHPSGTARASEYSIAAAYTTTIFKGDPVLLATDGTITRAAAGNTLYGVFVGCEYTDSTGKPNYSNFCPGTASCTDIKAYVITDAETVYEIQGVSALTQAAIGDECDISVYAAGSTSTGLSIVSAATGTLAGAGASAQLRIIGVAPYPDNALTDTYPILRVTINESALRAATNAV